MNGALTDECELTTAEDGAPPQPAVIYITPPLSHLSALHRDELWPTNSPYILEALGVLLFQQGCGLVLRCVIRETSDDRLPVHWFYRLA